MGDEIPPAAHEAITKPFADQMCFSHMGATGTCCKHNIGILLHHQTSAPYMFPTLTEATEHHQHSSGISFNFWFVLLEGNICMSVG